MSTFLLSILSGIGAGYLRGGSLRNLGALRAPSALLLSVWLALTLQVALRWIPGRMAGLNTEFALLVATYGAVAAVLGLYLVRLSDFFSPSGMLAAVGLVGFGWLLNFVVIALNRGMPSSGTTGGHSEIFLKHVPMSPETKLRFLGDVVYLAPFHEIVSAGDLVLALGLAVYVCAAMKPVRGSTPLFVTAGQRKA